MYEEEKKNVYEDRSDEILESSVTARLLSFPNVDFSREGVFELDEDREADYFDPDTGN